MEVLEHLQGLATRVLPQPRLASYMMGVASSGPENAGDLCWFPFKKPAEEGAPTQRKAPERCGKSDRFIHSEPRSEGLKATKNHNLRTYYTEMTCCKVLKLAVYTWTVKHGMWKRFTALVIRANQNVSLIALFCPHQPHSN